jgi:hypothetical protein
MNAAVIGVPECSEIPEVGPKDTDRDRDVKPARLQRADPDTIGALRDTTEGRPTNPGKNDKIDRKRLMPGTRC